MQTRTIRIFHHFPVPEKEAVFVLPLAKQHLELCHQLFLLEKKKGISMRECITILF